MTKKKIIKLFAILAAVFLGSLEMGWRFFNMVVCCKRGEHKKERKKWFELSHICLLYTSIIYFSYIIFPFCINVEIFSSRLMDQSL